METKFSMFRTVLESVAVGDGVGHHAGILPHPSRTRSSEPMAEPSTLLIAVDVLALVRDLPGPVHIQIAVAQHLRVDAQYSRRPDWASIWPTASGSAPMPSCRVAPSSMFSTTNSAMRVLRLRGRRGLYTGQGLSGGPPRSYPRRRCGCTCPSRRRPTADSR